MCVCVHIYICMHVCVLAAFSSSCAQATIEFQLKREIYFWCSTSRHLLIQHIYTYTYNILFCQSLLHTSAHLHKRCVVRIWQPSVWFTQTIKTSTYDNWKCKSPAGCLTRHDMLSHYLARTHFWWIFSRENRRSKLPITKHFINIKNK